MTQSSSNSFPLDTFINAYERVTVTSSNHIMAGAALAVAAIVVGTISYLALHYGLPAGSYSEGATIAMGSGAGTVFLSIALVSLAAHYAFQIVDKKRNANAFHFLDALKHDSFNDLTKTQEGRLVCKRYIKWMNTHFSDENFEVMLSYLADTLFDEEKAESAEPEMIKRVYDLLFHASPKRFIKLYGKMASEGQLGSSDEYLKNYVDAAISRMTQENFEELLAEIDQKEALYFKPMFEHVHFQSQISFFIIKACIKLFHLIDAAYFRSDSKESIKDKKACFYEIEWIPDLVKAYYKDRSSLSKEVRSLLDRQMEDFLKKLDTISWREIIQACDRDLIQSDASHVTPYSLVEKMCQLDRFKFDRAIGDGGWNVPPQIKEMSPSLQNWLHRLHDSEIAVEEARRHPPY